MIELISSRKAYCEDEFLSNIAVNKILNNELDQLVDPSLGYQYEWINKTVNAVAELAFRCLQQERDMRPSMAEVLETLESIRDERTTIALTWDLSSGHKDKLTNIHIVSRLPDNFFDK